ncbi:hypothetical protein MOQ72_27105 [Saccharopolyspora sp. K220]|uniref:hypothetical protein n=1 Tax=Saccharopolyspora soli TaxID=2926618 RepID=UPI001F57C0CC|nr:hypothetical protein [Saccharopolyspora soli]MCI2421117.1 hypothetical protein [Saccharopolyspora soli]
MTVPGEHPQATPSPHPRGGGGRVFGALALGGGGGGLVLLAPVLPGWGLALIVVAALGLGVVHALVPQLSADRVTWWRELLRYRERRRRDRSQRRRLAAARLANRRAAPPGAVITVSDRGPGDPVAPSAHHPR